MVWLVVVVLLVVALLVNEIIVVRRRRQLFLAELQAANDPEELRAMQETLDRELDRVLGPDRRK